MNLFLLMSLLLLLPRDPDTLIAALEQQRRLCFFLQGPLCSGNLNIKLRAPSILTTRTFR